MEPRAEDDFQFRPLTEGLGFHGKKTKARQLAQAFDEPVMSKSTNEGKISPPLTQLTSQSQIFPATNSRDPMEKISSDLLLDSKSQPSSPLVKNPLIPQRPPEPSKTTPYAQKVLDDLKKKRENLRIIETPSISLQPSYPLFSALLLDSLLLVASSLALIIAVVLMNQIDIALILNQLSAQEIFLGSYLIMAFVSWNYLFLFRLYLNRTPGEWTTDQLVETPIGPLRYFALAGRALLPALTGFVVLPLISYFIAKEDVAGALTKAWLRKEKLR